MNDVYYMKLALELAKSTKGQTSPNPMVGSVVVKDGVIVGMGAHLLAGEGHAEVQALTMAADKANGATIYVTLEPCSHYGKTPPCADLIIERGLKRVVVATGDSNPEVAGRGLAKLKNAGIEVEFGICQDEANELNEVFFHYMKEQLPFVTLKSATTLDGKTATVTGKSKWITGSKAREDVHRYRHEHDAILVGVGTVLADNPSLTTRLATGGKNPIRVVLDRTLRTPLDATLVQDQEAPTWILTTEHASKDKQEKLEQSGVHVIRMPDDSIETVLSILGTKGVLSLFVEGGAEINGSFVKARAVNQIITYLAPKIFGGKAAPTAVAGAGIEDVEEAIELEVKEVTTIGTDIKIVSRLKGSE
ncbi:bifunctional diaminohydroxyphosphoribosylaminopyrimidine deaminase/5-amino-6-(5-phosphoribosylamino)uracil reductase RibD [Alkalihalobacillus sp. MEB130]|uniref:bifunctional diaminohydroxyphosphoribosylaminopyrimidine deaminase/5-amino-6-(5-phosphoribosylamino)uracil reductase RibD n=1 Tax=Alkalihalobacillus sp. MEB130 TaxID=2976704 RepID=UPI0028DD67E2|nr:bifunctional diaminohydroxyphosphoribosylaminopyrimidine deaminase/5-amino-6-(5-phosphoribosylamino)uracil reductase RibD [Alkalihalobacillus sp. MEB130]MDT8860098.1 bifunctional diaminohydroxyphosphoribosylaminopyrimidine deaminase/5-amino-6-(5-phosphoribosylamino)uracil reductase RibD [Alkalihalobacillus sp. MEB130]